MMKILALSACLLAAGVAPAQAGCTQEDLAGNWGLYIQGQSGAMLTGLACDIAISATGAISSASGCINTSRGSSEITGSLKIANASRCDYTGSVTLVKNNDLNGFGRTTLSPDHNNLAGVGYSATTGRGYIFVMVRIE